MQPHDQSIRDQFVTETGSNFSVISPAGSGKTRAISDRVSAIARRHDAVQVLPTLRVVTFTQKAAEELRDRARAQVLAGKPSPMVMAAFNRAFFGTLHSFAITVLRSHGHYLGIPSVFSVIQDDSLVWREWLATHSGRPEGTDSAQFDTLLRLIPFGDVLDLVRAHDFRTQRPAVGPSAFELPNLDAIFAFPLPKRADTAANIQLAQAQCREWVNEFNLTDSYLPLPSITKGGAAFLDAARIAFAPAREWISNALMDSVQALAADYRNFRIRTGRLTFNDQVALAAELAIHPTAAHELRTQGMRIILDEAQDTDAHQFALLLEVTRPPGAPLGFTKAPISGTGPRPGHFSMVGDPQQSIYRERADLRFYLAVHDALLKSGSAECITFGVTFRCDSAIVEFANKTFPNVLNGESSQVTYVPLQARPGAGVGQLIRLPVPAPVGAGHSDYDLALYEARFIASRLASTGAAGINAKDWADVAIICPRRDWFFPLRQGFSEAGLTLSFQSTRETNADSPAYAWVTALLTVWAQPGNAIEVFGVLREIFAVSDHDIAVFTNKKNERLSIAADSPAIETDVSPVAQILRQIREAGSFLTDLPLREGVEKALTHLSIAGRLASLPSDVFVDVEADLESLLVRASDAQARGLSLATFAVELRAGLRTKIEPLAADESSIPVITNLKSKGLQWGAVIVPFFGRPISQRSPSYPQILPPGISPAVAFSRSEIPDVVLQGQKNAITEENERLLYVTLTRAQRSLIFIDDISLWSPGNGAVAAGSLAASLRIDGVNAAPWAVIEASSNLPDLERLPPPLTLPPTLPVLPKDASLQAEAFPRRILPHLLASHKTTGRKIEDPEQRTIVPGDSLRSEAAASLGIEYGIWWHQLMQRMAWGNPDLCNALLAHGMTTSPIPARAQKEIPLLQASELWAMIHGAKRVLSELPFTAPLQNGDSLDGIIDLVAIRVEGAIIVLDWKTDRAEPAKILEQYRDQINAYSNSVTALSRSPSIGMLYSTNHGVLMRV